MAHTEDSRQPVEFLPFESIAASNQPLHRECPICLGEYGPQALIPFGPCGHEFCRGCLSSHLKFSLTRYNLPKCPRELCSEELSTDSEGYRLLDENQRQRYSKIVSYLFIIRNPNYLPCQRENCTGLIDKTEDSWQCQLCGEKHCSDCYQLQHGGECGVRIAMEFETRSKFRQCKRCGQMIEKIEGCTHMSCTCGHYFCYSCGETLTHREHQCVPPAELNFFEAVRWSVEHQQLWYQFGDMSFLSYLLLVSPPRGSGVALQVIWAYVYLILIYPISMVLFTAIAVAAFMITCLLFLVFTLFVPFMPLFSDDAGGLWFSSTVQEQFGTFIGLLLILMLYPILYFVHLVQLMFMLQEEEDFTFERTCILPIELLKGLRNMALMPCLMLIDNERYYLALGRLRQTSLLNQQ